MQKIAFAIIYVLVKKSTIGGGTSRKTLPMAEKGTRLFLDAKARDRGQIIGLYTLVPL